MYKFMEEINEKSGRDLKVRRILDFTSRISLHTQCFVI